MKKILSIIILSLLWSNVGVAEMYAVKITKHLIPDLSIDITPYGIADETWKIVDTCKDASNYSLVELTRFGISPDITVEIVKYGIADKDICIINPEDLPKWFLKLLKEL